MNNDIKINRLRPVLIGFLVMTFISITPFINFINLFFCAGIVLGGVAGVSTYNKQIKTLNSQLIYKDALFIGLLSGILSAVAVSGFNIISIMYSDLNPINESLKMLGDFAKNIPPEADSQIRKLSDEFNKYGFSPTLAVFTFLSNLFIYPLFGIVGSLLTASILNNRKKAEVNL